MSKSIGSILKPARAFMGLTLRQTEEATGISNAYLSQLENDKIKQPSISILYKLSCLYRIQLHTLLVEAGLIENEDDSLEKHNNYLNRMPITDDEETKLKEFLMFLRFKSKNKL